MCQGARSGGHCACHGPLVRVQCEQSEPFYNSPIREGNTVTVTVPSCHPVAYLTLSDQREMRSQYCHCGWIKEDKEGIPLTFCYCGAGYYKPLWEGVLGARLRVTILISTSLNGSGPRGADRGTEPAAVPTLVLSAVPLPPYGFRQAYCQPGTR